MNNTEKEKDILLADDDFEDVAIFKAALSDINIPYAIRHAENGDMLFILLKDKLPAILFLDIHMPCKDGIACIIEIRKNRAYDHLPIIMYSSHTSANIIDNAFRNGANFYLPKPYSFEELTTKLGKIFSINWHTYVHYPMRDHFVL